MRVSSKRGCLWIAGWRIACWLLAFTGGLSVAQAQCNTALQCCPSTLGAGSPACNSAAGNPVNLANGTKFQMEVDVPAAPGILGLEILRYYNSEHAVAGVDVSGLGPGWRLGLDAEVEVGKDGSHLQWTDGTGERRRLERVSAQLFRSRFAPVVQVRVTGSNRSELQYQLESSPGRFMEFDHQGRLLQIRLSSGESTSMLRDRQGRLLEVIDPQQRSARFQYQAGQLTSVTLRDSRSSVEQIIEYRYSPQTSMLQAVWVYTRGQNSLSEQTRYAYTSQMSDRLLTSVSRRTGSASANAGAFEPSAGWDYDEKRRVVEAHRFKHGRLEESLQFRYLEGKKKNQSIVELLQAGQAPTLYQFENSEQGKRLVQVRGPGCNSCGASNFRLKYNPSGAVIERIHLDSQGAATLRQTARVDDRGRLRELFVADAPAKALGRYPVRPQLLVRKEYNYEGLLEQVVRPSVVSGREVRWRLRYNDKHQISGIVQTGWAPNLTNPQLPHELYRELQIDYQKRNGRSVPVLLRAIAPGLPAATMQIPWDQRADHPARISSLVQGFNRPVPARQTPPSDPAASNSGVLNSSLVAQFDGWGRPVVWHDEVGLTKLSATWGEPGTISQFKPLVFESQGRVARRQVDDFGRVVAVQLPLLGWAFAQYDQLDRVILTEDPRGARQRMEYGPAGQLIRLQRSGIPGFEEDLHFVYDQGRLQESRASGPNGNHIHRYAYDAHGRPIQKASRIEIPGVHPMEYSIEFSRDQQGRVVRQVILAQKQVRSDALYAFDQEGRLAAIDARVGAGVWGQFWWRRLAWTVRLWQPEVAGQQAAHRPASTPADLRLLERDAAGLPQRLIRDGSPIRLNWDAAARLAEVRPDQGPVYRYLYDAQGRRLAKLVMHQQQLLEVRYAMFDGARFVGQLDAEGELVEQQDFSGWQPVNRWRPPFGVQQTTAWLVSRDRSQALERTRDGRIVPRRHKPALHESVPDSPFIGQQIDAETGLYYHVSRFFNPTEMRFVSPDPLGVTDTLQAVNTDLLLDVFQFAGGRPDLFFDPDGAAKLSYFAVHLTGKPGQPPNPLDQGFQPARWAFHIEGIAPTADSSSALALKRNEYSGSGTELLFDGEGKFLSSFAALDATIVPDGSAIRWDNSSTDEPLPAFKAFYGQALSVIKPFSIDAYDDNEATKLIWYLSTPPGSQRAACRVNAPGWLPSIRFAPGEADIHVTKAVEPPAAGLSGNQANSQRILNCNPPTTMPVRFASDEERWRVMKYEAAAELQESPATSAINKDCSKNDGCRSSTAITVNGRTYFASYGRTQFIGETFLRTVRGITPELSAQERQKLRLDQAVVLPNGKKGDLVDLLALANARADRASRSFNDFRNAHGSGLDAEAAAKVWEGLSPAARTKFETDTGLGMQEFMDMLGFVVKDRARTEGEGRAAFGTEAAWRTTSADGEVNVGDWMRWLFATEDEYNFVSMMFLKKNLNDLLASKTIQSLISNPEADGTDAFFVRQRANEELLARRVAILHNSGSFKVATQASPQLSPNVEAYTREFMSVGGRGDWRSLRCSDELQTVRGLQTRALTLK